MIGCFLMAQGYPLMLLKEKAIQIRKGKWEEGVNHCIKHVNEAILGMNVKFQVKFACDACLSQSSSFLGLDDGSN